MNVAEWLLTNWGLPGLVILALAWWTLRQQTKAEEAAKAQALELIQTRERLELEHAARLSDAQQNTKAQLALNDKMHETVAHLAELAERLTPPKP